MKHRIPFLVLAVLIVAALACGGGTTPAGGGGGGATGPKVLFEDDFSDSGSGWDILASDTSSTDYGDGYYVINLQESQWLAWANPYQNFSDIHVEVTARSVGKAKDAGFGIICDYNDGDFYYLAISQDGFYVIAKSEGEDTTALTSDENLWLESDKITVNAKSYRLGADCANGTLTLYVDGDEIASVDDDTFTDGDVGLIGATFDGPNAEIRFDDFVVTELK